MTNQPRDIRADVASFETVIQGRRVASETFRAGLANNRVPERRIAKVRMFDWLENLKILYCSYSIGVELAQLRSDFATLIARLPDLLEDGKLVVPFELHWLAAWAVLLDDVESAETLAYVQARNERFYPDIVLPLLSSIITVPEPQPSQVQYDELDAFNEARDAQLAGDTQAASDRLFEYVDKEWYRLQRERGQYDTHKNSGTPTYLGYWAWDAAGTAKAFGIDDSALQGHEYYPWDLAHHDD